MLLFLMARSFCSHVFVPLSTPKLLSVVKAIFVSESPLPFYAECYEEVIVSLPLSLSRFLSHR